MSFNIIGGAARTAGCAVSIGRIGQVGCANFSKVRPPGSARKDGVNVNVIPPGLTETDRVVTLLQHNARRQRHHAGIRRASS